MFQKYDNYLLGTHDALIEIFNDWDFVKDEVVLPSRKTGTGNGTVHFFLLQENNFFIKKLLDSHSEKNIEHLIDVNFLYSLCGVTEYLSAISKESKQFKASNYIQEVIPLMVDGFLQFKSVLKFQETRPYFKQFDENFLKYVRVLLFPKVFKYKVKLYQHKETKVITAAWVWGYGNYDNLNIVKNELQNKVVLDFSHSPIQRILYGSPGTGKSYSLQAITQNSPVFRTTFHPELDFHGFVGGYRPAMKGEGEDEKITYQFVPQVFMQAYTAAWNDPSEMHYLVIEEINRGNCAAIFGSLFQLLDRDEEGFSEYSIQADAEQAKYLEEVLDYDYEPLISALYEAKTGVELDNPYSILMLPNNLSIIATMNTSDQSLYPMDSAFKRRWDWEYCPIDYAKADEIRVSIGDMEYNWGAFLRSVNQKIYTLTHSEDKQLGTFFAKAKSGIISQAVFCNKVLFFLWNDILKDENPNDANNFFKDASGKPFTFTQLHQTDTVAKIHSIFAQLNVPML
jgi:AAA domain (dynein-related subfamily)